MEVVETTTTDRPVQLVTIKTEWKLETLLISSVSVVFNDSFFRLESQKYETTSLITYGEKIRNYVSQ